MDKNIIDLDSEIYYLRENDENNLKYGNPFSDEYKEIVKYYNELCDRHRKFELIID